MGLIVIIICSDIKECHIYSMFIAQEKYVLKLISGHMNGGNNYDARQEYMNNEQLKVMYEVSYLCCFH